MGTCPCPSFFLFGDKMKKILFTFLFLLVAFPVYAYELLMFSNPHCGYCQSFLKEVAPTYADTEYAKILPLKVIQVNNRMPDWIGRAFNEGKLNPIVATPTFVIWDNKEIARLEGYPGKETFYEMIGAFVEENTGEFKMPPSRGPMDEFGSSRVPPEGVINSRDLFQHMYKTPELALKASDWFGCHGNIHYHKDENVWMPCNME
jgi:thiol-disulfide isomerase/thioredoxin